MKTRKDIIQEAIAAILEQPVEIGSLPGSAARRFEAAGIKRFGINPRTVPKTKSPSLSRPTGREIGKGRSVRLGGERPKGFD